MTREEAIAYGKRVIDLGLNDETQAFCELAIKALEEQPSEDCISRKAIIDALHRYFADGFDSDKWWNSTYVLSAINEVPSATPQPKTGHWIWCASSHKCSNCGGYACFSHEKLLKYCPNCGARMKEAKE